MKVQYVLFISFLVLVGIFCIGIFKRQLGPLYGYELMVRTGLWFFVAVAAIEITRILKQ